MTDMHIDRYSVQTAPVIQYHQPLSDAKTPVRDGAPFYIKIGHDYVRCVNMVAENFQRIVTMRLLGKVEVEVFEWEPEHDWKYGPPPADPVKSVCIVTDSRVPRHYLTPVRELDDGLPAAVLAALGS